MPDSKPAEQSSAPKQEPPKAAAQQAPQSPRQGNSGQNTDPTTGLRAEVQAQHKARTEVPGRPGVDGRLDNRQGRFAPPIEEWPAKPQQIDGPDLAHQAEHTRRTLKDLEDAGPRKGMYSPGPHGLSDESLRETDQPLFGTESVPESDLDSGSKG